MSDWTTDVVENLRSRAGGALQAVIIYDSDTHRDLYRRDDVEKLHGSDLESEVLADIRSDQRRRESDAASEHEGQIQATVRVFETRVIVHLPRDSDSGTVLVMDTSVAKDLTEFVEYLREDLYGRQ